MPLIRFGGSRKKRKSPDAMERRGFLRGREIPACLQLHLDHHGLVLVVAARGIERDVGRLVA